MCLCPCEMYWKLFVLIIRAFVKFSIVHLCACVVFTFGIISKHVKRHFSALHMNGQCQMAKNIEPNESYVRRDIWQISQYLHGLFFVWNKYMMFVIQTIPMKIDFYVFCYLIVQFFLFVFILKDLHDIYLSHRLK